MYLLWQISFSNFYPRCTIAKKLQEIKSNFIKKPVRTKNYMHGIQNQKRKLNDITQKSYSKILKNPQITVHLTQTIN